MGFEPGTFHLGVKRSHFTARGPVTGRNYVNNLIIKEEEHARARPRRR